MEKLQNYKITKISQVAYVSNMASTNYYFLVYVKLGKYEYDTKFIVSFDLLDCQEYYDQDYATKKQLNEYKYICANAFLENLIGMDIDKAYYVCRDTVVEFNKMRDRYWGYSC